VPAFPSASTMWSHLCGNRPPGRGTMLGHAAARSTCFSRRGGKILLTAWRGLVALPLGWRSGPSAHPGPLATFSVPHRPIRPVAPSFSALALPVLARRLRLNPVAVIVLRRADGPAPRWIFLHPRQLRPPLPPSPIARVREGSGVQHPFSPTAEMNLDTGCLPASASLAWPRPAHAALRPVNGFRRRTPDADRRALPPSARSALRPTYRGRVRPTKNDRAPWVSPTRLACESRRPVRACGLT